MLSQYDDAHDIMRIILGEGRATYSFKASENVFLHVEPWTDKLLGVTIYEFSSVDTAQLDRLVPLNVNWGTLMT